MSLILDIEYLVGTSFAAVGPDSDTPDWPPQPDRIFSALVATWGAHGETHDEQNALRWLEQQPVPKLEASDHFPRTPVKTFVPPNDVETGRLGDKRVMPAFRHRQERRFPATRPHRAMIRLCWTHAEPDEPTLRALCRLAEDTPAIGHSSSLTRCLFRRAEEPVEGAKLPSRRIYPGRLDELQRAYKTFVESNGAKGRPLNGVSVPVALPTAPEWPHVFTKRWLLLESVSDAVPDIRATAILSRAIRDAMLSGYKQIGLERDIPEIVSGHTSDGGPARNPHLAIIALAFVGFPHSDGHVMGFAVVPPFDSDILDDALFRRVWRTIAPVDEDRGRRILTLKAFSVRLSPTFEPPAGKRSLDPEVYTRPARTFASVTPVVLDRHLKRQGEARISEIVDQLAAACRNVGLPVPELAVPDKHSAVDGAPSAYVSTGSPSWMQWRIPSTLSSRALTHAVIRFAEPVQGPVLLGAGRFVGMGLFRPVMDPKESA